MNPLSYYTRQKEAWLDEELEQLKREYVSEEKTISEIGDIHRRTPGSVAYKLWNLKVVEQPWKGTRGYDEYKLSPLYQEIVSVESAKREQKGEKKTEKKKKEEKPVQEPEVIECNVDIQLIRNDIKTIKSDIKNMKEGIAAILAILKK